MKNFEQNAEVFDRVSMKIVLGLRKKGVMVFFKHSSTRSIGIKVNQKSMSICEKILFIDFIG